MRTSLHNDTTTAGGHLVEIVVERTATYNIQSVEGEIGKLIQPSEHLTIAKCKTVEDATDYLGIPLRHILPRSAAIILYSTNHRRWIGKGGIIRVYKTLERLLSHSLRLQVGMRLRCVGKLLAATLVNPHSTYILKETCRAINTALVGEVQLTATGIDDGIAGLDTHKAPCSRTEIGETLVGCGDSCHSTCRIMTSHRHNRHSSKTSDFLHLGSKCTNHCSWHSHFAEFVSCNTKTGEQIGIKVLGHRIEQLRRGCHRIFTNGISSKHITECIWNK